MGTVNNKWTSAVNAFTFIVIYSYSLWVVYKGGLSREMDKVACLTN